MDTGLVTALKGLLAYLISQFGPNGTLILILGAVLFLALRRLYLDHRADSLTTQALEEKERTIQRIANQERQWRLYFLIKEGNLSRKEAEKLVLQNEYSTPKESREALEGKKDR